MEILFGLFTQDNNAFLFTSIIAAVFAVASSWLTYRFVNRREMVESHQFEADAERKERVRSELTKWSNDVNVAVDDLYGRLGAVLHQNGYVALNPAFVRAPNAVWSVTHDYYMTSTLFLFGQFFGWIQLLREDVNYEIFRNAREKKELAEAMLNVTKSLGDYPLTYCMGHDSQVFRLQQRAIAELFTVSNEGTPRMLRYHEFMQRMNEPDFAPHLNPLRELLTNVSPEGDCRWPRLEHLYGSLGTLKAECNDVLGHERILALISEHPEN